MRVRRQGARIPIREGGQSWGLFTEGTGSEVRVGVGHACERARSSVSDPRGGSELGIDHRGYRFGGESGALGMRVRGQGAWIRIREGGQSWELFTEGTGSEVRVGGWACVREGKKLGFESERGIRVGN